jgi:polyphosphate glucokinase
VNVRFGIDIGGTGVKGAGPDLVIIGGGVSKAREKFMPLLESKATIVPATLANLAGIIGAALAAE